MGIGAGIGMLPAISTGVRASNAPAMASDLAYDAFMALPDDARRANYEALVRDARSTQHKPMRRVNAQKRERLRTMKVLILDNSQREPSVASVWVGPGVPRPNPISRAWETTKPTRRRATRWRTSAPSTASCGASASSTSSPAR